MYVHNTGIVPTSYLLPPIPPSVKHVVLQLNFFSSFLLSLCPAQ